ncbi:MAG: succinate dehydrogenase/fumarate reductase iron-sulfur subunit [Pseudomonadota bacterium]
MLDTKDDIASVGATGTLDVSVWRGTADGGIFQDFRVPAQDSQTVLDVVAWIQQNDDPTLAYRYACRVGMCGSCAMMVNGVPRWTCRTHVKKVLGDGKLIIAPLRNMPVIKDLAADMDPFFDKWVAAEAVFHPSSSRDDGVAPVDPASAPRVEADAGIECINCAVCYAACDVVSANPDYLGPAALNRAWTLFNDAKDDGKAAILDAVSGTGGCHNCHSMGSCARHCPNELNPTAAIAGLKRETVKAALGFGPAPARRAR